MKIVFVHQNLPGQFKHVAQWFGKHPAHQAAFITARTDRDIPGVRRVSYKLHRQPNPKNHHYLIRTEAAVLYGQAVVRALMDLQKDGFTPDIVVGHSGWGEILYAKELLPKAALLSYSEFYYLTSGADIGFDPSVPQDLDGKFRTVTRNAHFLLSLAACDAALTPTEWQRSVHPREFHSKFEVIHEGIDTALLKPDPQASFTLPDGRVLTAADKVVTYVARNLEPYRGFPTFIRALPAVLDAHPDAQVLVVGGNEVSYGAAPEGGGSWRDKMLEEVPLDTSRVHFLGKLPYLDYIKALQISSAHVYLTFPFVLSWSALEAMSIGCLMIGSRTAPVEEVIEDGVNGVLVDFFKHEDVAEKINAALSDRGAFAPMRAAARETVLERYEVRKCLDRQLSLIHRLTESR